MDKTLEAYAGREEEMFQALVAKYGPEPTCSSSPTTSPHVSRNMSFAQNESHYTARLTAFYEKYNPAKVSSVDKALAAYAGREDEMFAALVAKYGPEPEPVDPKSDSVSSGSKDFKARLTAFYEKYNPAKVKSVEKTLEAYAGREEEMFEALVAKYGPEPVSNSLDQQTGTAESGSTQATGLRTSGATNYKGRLTAFYEKYNPAKVQSVDKTLESYAGREEEMFEALVAKYGPEPTSSSQSVSSDYKARLTAFYEKYNPGKVSSVDKTLQAYGGREEEMFAALVSKYGPEPQVPSQPVERKTTTTPSNKGMDYKGRLTAFYEKYNPAKVSSVDKTLEAYAGREEEMFQALVAKYGPEPAAISLPPPPPEKPQPPAVTVPSTTSDYRTRLAVFYEKYNPAKLSSVDKTLAAYAGREEEIFEALVAKYGPEPTGSAEAPSMPTSASGGSSTNDFKPRLIAIFEKYAPNKLGTVDAALEKYSGREEDLISALVAKYGPEPAVSTIALAVNEANNNNNNNNNAFADRLTAFYEKYAPGRVSSVAATLGKYEGREEDLFAALVAKYGPEPAQSGAAPFSGRLRRFYSKYAPNKVDSVDSTLQKYEGREEELFTALCAKYGPEPAANDDGASAVRSLARKEEHVARLTRIYEAYDPSKVEKVNSILSKYEGREEDLFDALVAKYGPEPSPAVAPQPESADEPRPAKSVTPLPAETTCEPTERRGADPPPSAYGDHQVEPESDADAIRLEKLMKEEGVKPGDEAAIRLLKRLIHTEKTARGSSDADHSDPPVSNPQDPSADRLVAFMSKEEEGRSLVIDLMEDEFGIAFNRLKAAIRKTFTKEQLRRLVNTNTDNLMRRYFEKFLQGAKKIRAAKRRAAVESMTNYQKMQLTPSAKHYYSRMEELERQKEIKQRDQQRRAQAEREKRMSEAYARGDFVRRNKEEASLSPHRSHLSVGPKSVSPKSPAVSRSKQRQSHERPSGRASATPAKTKVRKEVMREKLADDFARMPAHLQCSLLRRMKKQNLPVPFNLRQAMTKSATLGYMADVMYDDDDFQSEEYSEVRHRLENRAEDLFASPIAGNRSGDLSRGGSPLGALLRRMETEDFLHRSTDDEMDAQELEAFMESVLAEADRSQ